jgi:adenylate cyclase
MRRRKSRLGPALRLLRARRRRQASCFEGQTKTYHVDIILGERTALQVPQFAMLEIDLILVVGKTKPVRIFFLLGDESVRATSAFATSKARMIR